VDGCIIKIEKKLSGLEILMSIVLAQDFDPVLSDPLPFTKLRPTSPSDFFAEKPKNEMNFGGKDGVIQGNSFSKQETARIEKLIHQHIIERIGQLSSEAGKLVAGTELENYHLIANQVCEMISPEASYASLFSKGSRILAKNAVQEIKEMSFFDYLTQGFANYYLSDEENIGHEQICFRIVRPNERDDVGSLHRDRWFWEHYGFALPEGWGRAKVWTQICGDPEQSGLLLSPGSHLVDGGFKISNNSGKLMFISELDKNLPINRFSGNLGDTVMFNYGNLHTGSLNKSSTSRVSIEITVIFKADA
jgi:hypothetical protein